MFSHFPPAARGRVVSRRVLLSLTAACLPLLARAEASSAAVAPISALYTALERLMHEGKGTPFIDRFRQLAPVIDQAFDLRDILMRSVGLHWSGFSDAVRGRLFDSFRKFTIVTYVANFDHYDGEKFQLLPDQRSVGADRVVASRIVEGNGNAVRIDYVMRQVGQDWRVVDVLLDGSISRVAVQRSDFRALLAKGGADALIQSLQSKISDLSGGARLDS